MKVIQIIEKYLESNKLDIHISSGHKKEKMFGCEICGKSLCSKAYLAKHIYTIHEGKKQFTCEICGKSFFLKTQLAQHIGAIHEGKKPFKCDICDYRCSAKGDMNKHVHQFMKERSHLCVKFVTIAVLKRVT